MTRYKGGAFALALALLAGCTPQPPALAPRTETPPPPAKRSAPERVALLLNMPADALITTLGNPVLRKTENGGEVWLYAHANGCSLDVVLFPVKSVLMVAHATTEKPARITEAECLSAIANIAR